MCRGALLGGVPAVNRAPNAASKRHKLRVFPPKRACPPVPAPRPSTLRSSMSPSHRHWSSSPPTAPSPKLGQEAHAGRRGTRHGEAMPLSPPCNANRNRKGPNSKVLIQAQAPWPRVEVWGPSPAGGTGGLGAGHASVRCALRDEGAEPCDDGPAAAGTSVCTSSCCIPGPEV